MKLTKDLISIIIPVYNREDMLERCMKSLVSQTYKKIELIFIDDGSTDNSLSILRKYEQIDNRIKVYSQANKGAAAARNLGISNAQGEYLMFCDSDDEYLSEMCKEMLKAIKTNKVDLVMCNAKVILEDKQINNELSKKRFKELDQYCNSVEKNKIINLDKSKPKLVNVLLWNKILKHQIIIDNDILFPEDCELEDNFFIFLYSLFVDKYFTLNKSLYRHHIHSNSMMDLIEQGKHQSKYDLFKICCHIFTFLKSKKILDDNELSLKKFIINKMSNLKVEFFTYQELISLCKEFNNRFKSINLICVYDNFQLIVDDAKNRKRKILIKLIIRILKTVVLPKKKNINKIKNLISDFKNTY